MIIIGQSGKEILNSSQVSAYYIDESILGATDDKKVPLCAAILEKGLVIGWYKDVESAKSALNSIFNVLSSEKITGQKSYQVE